MNKTNTTMLAIFITLGVMLLAGSVSIPRAFAQTPGTASISGPVTVDNTGLVSGTFVIVPLNGLVSSITVSAKSTETITTDCQLTTPGTSKVITKTATFTATGEQTFSNVNNKVPNFSVQTTASGARAPPCNGPHQSFISSTTTFSNPTATITSQTNDFGTLLVIKRCTNCPSDIPFTIQITGNNPSASTFVLTPDEGVTVTLSPGAFTIAESASSLVLAAFSGDCTRVGSSFTATGTISAGQQLTCTITNTVT